jgi:hypothetical protein
MYPILLRAQHDCYPDRIQRFAGQCADACGCLVVELAQSFAVSVCFGFGRTPYSLQLE